MIIKAIYIGNTDEAFICKDFTPGFNIVYSDDNNKGKTIVIQAIMYCLGNKPAFPTSFHYDDYYYILHIEHNRQKYKICRKDKNIFVNNGFENVIFDNISEFKRYWSKDIEQLPVIHKGNLFKIVDPELFVQLFFVGQDKKLTYDIINKGYYKKEDLYSMIYAIGNITSSTISEADIEKFKTEIKSLSLEKQQLLKENKILKSSDVATEVLGMTNDRLALESILKEADIIKDKILDLKKERSKAIARKKKNEVVLKELRSLNRNINAGAIVCMDCGSSHISYESADAEFSFDISTTDIRTQILKSIEEKVEIYDEEIIRLTQEINTYQVEFDKCLEVDTNVSLDVLLIVKKEMDNSRSADRRISEIDGKLRELKDKLEVKVAVSEDIEKKQKEIMESIIKKMNEFYMAIDLSCVEEYSDIFTSRDRIYSGSEGTEFHLSKMFAYQQILKHDYPIIVDSFRAEDLSTDREKRVLEQFSIIENQIIFTTTLKNEEKGKYNNLADINAINFSTHETNHILSKQWVPEFVQEMNALSLKYSET